MNQTFKSSKDQPAPTADIRDITDLRTPLGQQVVVIYERSFPEAERAPVEAIAANLQSGFSRGIYHLRALVEQENAVGFTYFSIHPKYRLGFLKFIAVREDIRGKGYGPILLQDAIRQLHIDGVNAAGRPYLDLVFEVERPELAESDLERQMRERRMQFYQRNGAVMIEGIDFIAPPVAAGQPSMPYHLMVLQAAPEYGVQRRLRQEAVKALLIEGYGEAPDSWFVRHALKTPGMPGRPEHR